VSPLKDSHSSRNATGQSPCSSSPIGEVPLVQSLTDKCLDQRLAADLQCGGFEVNFGQEICWEIDFNGLHRGHHAATICEETGNVLPLFGQPGDPLSWDRSLTSTMRFHRFPLLRLLPSRTSRDGNIRHRHLHDIRKLQTTVSLAPSRSHGTAQGHRIADQGSTDVARSRRVVDCAAARRFSWRRTRNARASAYHTPTIRAKLSQLAVTGSTYRSSSARMLAAGD